MNSLVPILDAGHGYLENGKYFCIAGGRRAQDGGRHFFEGEFNKSLVARIAERLAIDGIPFYLLNPEVEDTKLSVRVKKANKIYQKDKRAYLISFHSNAGGGTGFEVYTHVGESFSDRIATHFISFIENDDTMGKFKFRKDLSDFDPDKEKNFYILRKTMCPAILTENLFFDNESDLQYLLDLDFRSQLAGLYAKAIKALYYNVGYRT